ncbi:MAG: hypothetical protein ACRDYY_03690 [Acidimicrobiales bacterium]
MQTDLGERFARTVAAQDGDTLKELLAPRVNFRALTPGRCWESNDADAVVDDVILGTWFPPDRAITRILAVERAAVGTVERVGYRFQAALPDGDFVIEQQAYFRTENEKMSWLRIVCSGFVRDE